MASTTSTPSRGILKSGGGSAGRREKPRRKVAWDEGNIEACEAGKDATMKCTEPKTPFNFGYLSQSDEDRSDVEMKAEAARVSFQSLDSAFARAADATAVVGFDEDDDEEEDDDSVAREMPRRRARVVGFSGEDDDASMTAAAAAASLPAAAIAAEEEEARRAEHEEFERRRKQHYDEFRVVRALRERARLAEAEDEDVAAQQSAAPATPTSYEGGDEGDDEGGDEGDL